MTPIWAVSTLQPLAGSADLGDQVSSKLLASRLDNLDWPRDGEHLYAVLAVRSVGAPPSTRSRNTAYS